MSGAHSILPPSGAKAWRVCAMWPTMNRLYPKPDTPDTLAGNAAHWAFEELLAGRQIAEGLIAPNGVVMTQEMVEGAELVRDTVNERITGVHDFGPLQVEQRVAIPIVHPECFGTPDIWCFWVGGVLEVIDYKFGHRFVDEYENDQCVTYVAGILDMLATQLGMPIGVLDQRVRVNITVVQPRCYYRGKPVRTWSVMASDLRGQINQLSHAAHLALSPNPPAVTNSECIDCAGRGVCAALQRGAYSDAEVSVQSTPVDLSPEAASLELHMLERALERLEARVDGMRETVTAHLKQGRRLPFHHAEQGYGRQEWTLPADQVIAMGALMGADLAKQAVKTPKQALAAGVDEAVIKAYSRTPLGSVKLVPDNPSDARRVFSNT